MTHDRTHGDGHDGIAHLCRLYDRGPVTHAAHEAFMAHVTPDYVLRLIEQMRRYRSNWSESDRLRELAEADLTEMLGERS